MPSDPSRRHLAYPHELPSATPSEVCSASHQQSGTSSQAKCNAEQLKGEPPESFWQKTFNDPVATFTLWLTIMTAILAVSTIGLWIVTWLGAKKQARDMTASITHAETAAKAAQASADVAARAFADIERPYLFIIGPKSVEYARDVGEGDGFFVRYSVANYGRLPAIIRDVGVSVSYLHNGEPMAPPFIADNHKLSREPYGIMAQTPQAL